MPAIPPPMSLSAIKWMEQTNEENRMRQFITDTLLNNSRFKVIGDSEIDAAVNVGAKLFELGLFKR